MSVSSPVEALVFEDAFTDTNGTPLADHTPTGTNTLSLAWQNALGKRLKVVTGNIVQLTPYDATQNVGVYCTINVGQANYHLVASVKCVNNSFPAYILLRYKDPNTYLYVQAKTDAITLRTYSGGAGVQLGDAYTISPAETGYYDIEVVNQGDVVQVLYKGNVVIEVSDAFANDGTNVGIGASYTAATFDSFKVYLIPETYADPRIEQAGFETTKGTLPLGSTVTYPANSTNLPVVVFIPGWDSASNAYSTAVRQRLANYGIMAVFPTLRGRRYSAGLKDAGALEVYDLYDAIQQVLAQYTDIVDPSRIYIVGTSGGGGIAYNAITKMPDLFAGAVVFYGMSDYGYDGTYGWYYQNVSYQSGIATRVGGTPAVVPDNYHSRDALLAITNYYGGYLHMFHDQDDGVVPVSNSQRVADALDAASLTNYTFTKTTSADNPRATHTGDFSAFESVFIPEITGGAHAGWQIDVLGTLQVGGFLLTSRFDLMLGSGVEKYGQVVYDMSTRTFTITCNTGAATWSLTLHGQTPNSSISATVNGAGDSQTSDANGDVTFTGSV